MEGGYGFKLNHIFMGNGKKTCRFIQMSNAFRIFLLLEICCTHGNQVWKGNDPALALPDFSLKLFHFELFVINRARDLSRKNGRGDKKIKIWAIKVSLKGERPPPRLDLLPSPTKMRNVFSPFV